MGKGSGRRPLLISEQEAEDNWNRIFKKKFKCNGFCGHHECLEHQTVCVRLNKQSRMDVIGSNGNEGLHYEYELNKSTGEVEKRFKNGFEKPNEEQFHD